MCRMRIEYLLTKAKNDFCNTKEQFIHLLLTNNRLSINGDLISFSNNVLSYTLDVTELKSKKNSETFLYFIVSCTDKDENSVEILEKFDDLLHRICDALFVINTIWDEVSMYYEELLYPKIVRIENTLRKIIYRFMIKNVGSNWYNDATPDEVKKSINHVQDKNSNANKASDQLYDADFIQLKEFFFKHYPIRPLTQYSFLPLYESISTPDKSVDVDALREFIKLHEMKSNWDRYFSDKINVEGLDEKWEKLYLYRNKVAHSKRIKKAEYENAITIISELTSAFDTCLQNIDSVELTQEQAEAVTDQNRSVVHESLLSMALSDSLKKSMLSISETIGQYVKQIALEYDVAEELTDDIDFEKENSTTETKDQISEDNEPATDKSITNKE